MSQGRQETRSNKKIKAIVGFLFGILFLDSASASVTIRDIVLKGNQEAEIVFDSTVDKRSIEVDYVRDIVQLSVHKSTIYPAKILHAQDQVFSKVFGYQYSPSLVRVRFTVEGEAKTLQGKVQLLGQGNRIVVRFPNAAAAAPVVKEPVESQEASEQKLIDKVLQSEAKVEKPESKPLGKKKGEKLTTSSTANSSGSSLAKSFFAMFLIVGVLGVVLVFVKRKKRSTQATRVGDSWISNLVPQGLFQSMRKTRSPIEVLAQHALGPKQSITVVRIRGQQFVLGVTQDSVQLITQLDADENEIDVLENPEVAESIGRMFGANPAQTAQKKPTKTEGDNFQQLLKGSTGASAIMGRAQYAQQFSNREAARPAPVVAPSVPASTSSATSSSVRDQIRKRLEMGRSV